VTQGWAGLPGDLREEAFCEKLVADAVSGLDGLDILVSNAGRQQTHSSILDISTEQFDWTIKTNIYAPSGSSRLPCRICSPDR
jgi:NAD(P)-dependent dehydrogenase (short-subunit alcohol dehydrogenase family)